MTVNEAYGKVEEARVKIKAILDVIIPQAQEADGKFDAPLFGCGVHDLNWGFIVRRAGTAYTDLTTLSSLLEEMDNAEEERNND